MNLPAEPKITINGVELSEGQAMFVRVAISVMLLDLQVPAYRAELGPIADGYLRRGNEVIRIAMKGTS